MVLVYDVTKESSLRALELWLEELEQHGVCREVPRILVGNKCDEGNQQVPTAAAQRWADDRYQTRFTIELFNSSLKFIKYFLHSIFSYSLALLKEFLWNSLALNQ